jgi:hypothetical protein
MRKNPVANHKQRRAAMEQGKFVRLITKIFEVIVALLRHQGS